MVALHLLPGALTMVALVALAPVVIRAGAPADLAYQAAAGLVGVPVMLLLMRRHARRVTGRANIWAVIEYRRRPPAWAYPALLVPMLIWAFGLYFANGPLRDFLARDVFGWMPAYLRPGWEPPAPPARGLVLAALLIQLVVDGVLSPTVEELYFRGFLLPRLGRLGAWAPLANMALFAVQHFWQPWNWTQIFLIMLPLAYLVWWQQSVWLSVAMHCAGNTIGATLAIVAFASS